MDRRVFVSYASDNRRNDSDRKLFDAFIEDLENEVAQHLAAGEGELMFVANRDIQAGNDWTESLADALCTSQVMVCFGSMHYFNSAWCGREFQIFSQRREAWCAGHPGKSPRVIIPIPWIPVTQPPAVFSAFQETDVSFPSEYRELGLRKLLELERRSKRVEVITALGQVIREALVAKALEPWPRAQLPALREVANAFVPSEAAAQVQAADPDSGDSSACFVFLAGPKAEMAKAQRADIAGWGARDGWGWRPFHPQCADKVGELAQRAASDRKMRFVQLDCDAALTAHLKQAKEANTPVVIFADPWTARLEAYRKLLAEYDDVNLLNCALLVPWNRQDPETAASEPALLANLRAACKQKMKQQYPSHYWQIATAEELTSRALSVLDEITIRIVDAADTGELRRAESVALSALAMEQGIHLDAQPSLQAVGAAGPVA